MIKIWYVLKATNKNLVVPTIIEICSNLHYIKLKLSLFLKEFLPVKGFFFKFPNIKNF